MRTSFERTRRPGGGAWAVAVGVAAILPLGATSAQESRPPFAPPGRLRIDVTGSFLAFDSRFGIGPDGGSRVEPLGRDLTADDFSDLFTGTPDLEEAIRSLIDDSEYDARIGAIRTIVSSDQTRVPIRLELGVFDWLTVGGTVPFVKNVGKTAVDFDGAESNLGVNPGLVAPSVVEDYLTELDSARVRAAALAESLCAPAPGAAECTEAQALAADVDAFFSGVGAAYGAATFFPSVESTAGIALDSRSSELSGRLGSAGLPGLAALPLPDAFSSLEDLESFLNTQLVFESLDDGIPLWEVGDIELSAIVRVLEGGTPPADVRDGRPDFRFEVGAGALVRLGTGTPNSANVPFDQGGGDGQTDLEGRVFGTLLSGRWGLWADARYGIQLSGTTVRRLGPPDVVLLSPRGLANVDWTPGNYVRIEVAPRYQLSRELSVSLGYHLWSKGEDRFELLPPEPMESEFPVPAGNLFLSADPLEEQTEETRHDLGLGLTYSTLPAWRQGSTDLPLEIRFLLRRAMAGEGGRTRKTFRTEIGFTVYPRIWGG